MHVVRGLEYSGRSGWPIVALLLWFIYGSAWAAQSGRSDRRVVHATIPEYLPIFRQALYEGTVVVRVTVDAGGAVTDAEVIRIPAFNREAYFVDVARRWVFEPAGDASRIDLRFHHEFVAEDAPKEELVATYVPPYRVELRARAMRLEKGGHDDTWRGPLRRWKPRLRSASGAGEDSAAFHYPWNWNAWRSQNSMAFLSCDGDFDGNGTMDGADLYRRNHDGRFFLTAYVDTSLHKLVELTEDELDETGIETLRPGRYETRCGARGSCGPGEPAFAELDHDGILLFRRTGERTVFFWEAARASFRPIALAPHDGESVGRGEAR